MKNLQGYFDALLEDGYIVKDDIERRYLNIIPLWMFGLKSGFPPLRTRLIQPLLLLRNQIDKVYYLLGSFCH